MRKDLGGRLVLDASALIELTYSTQAGLRLKESLRNGLVQAYATELGISELRYVLCRTLGSAESDERVDKLLASGYIAVEGISSLIKDASKCKGERSISLADCFCLALARKSFCSTLFSGREKDLVSEMEKKPFDVEILFLEDYVNA
nr:PIN domain-containing protein [Candidatus Njordarchaeota archaeon]